MKKLLSIMLVFALMISSFTACAKKETSNEDKTTSADTSVTDQKSDTKDADDTTGGERRGYNKSSRY